MLLWFAGTSFLAVWLVFRDPAIDHRMVMAGAVLPDVVDGATGGPWVFHSVLASVGLLALVMAATVRRRLLRRRLIVLPIGTFLHLVFDGAWGDTDTFWWPFTGGFGEGRLPSIERGVLSLVLEVVGLAIFVWAYRRFRLGEREHRDRFLRTGRLPRELVS
ncbi:MAG TPA: hypothetical protein VM262_16720 [Acidimicrobiales bacterium]|nr:hypothetical protein [Acidimicrobiales bacterium]